MLGQRPNVIGAVTEWWNVDDETMNSIVEVRTKAPFLDHAPKVTMGCADEPHVDVSCQFAPNATHVPRFEHPEETCLEVGWELGDLVEKQRSSVRLLECAAVRLNRPRERPALVAEQLAFDQVPRQPSSVERYERPCAPRGTLVQSSRNELFSHARLAANQRGPWKARKSIDIRHDRKHRAGGDDRHCTGARFCTASACDAQLGSADPEDPARSKPQSLNADAIDPGPIRAPEIANEDRLRRGLDAAVEPTHRAVGESDRVARGGADGERPVRDLKGLRLTPSSLNQGDRTWSGRRPIEKLGAHRGRCFDRGFAAPDRIAVPDRDGMIDRHDRAIAEPR